jgi:hypothetical protein
MKQHNTISATVNTRLLSKADRLFTGSLRGRIIEVLQNARRAGATRVQINHDGSTVVVHDNGRGIEDFERLLDLGGSNWDPAQPIEQSEDPAGVGLFCLAPRKLTIESRGRRVVIEGDGWRGSPVTVAEGVRTPAGTTLRFVDEPWEHQVVEPLAVFTGMRVTVDERVCASEPFIQQPDVHDAALGCRLQVIPRDRLNPWQRHAARLGCMGETNVVVNFHGQTVGFVERPISERDLFYFIDLTGKPTAIRLMLPARTQLVENDALTELKALIEREAYRYVLRRGRHRLPYQEYLRAHEFGVDLPEAEPTFRVGLLCDDGTGLEPAEVIMPEGFDVSRCYRFDADSMNADEPAQTNAHLLAALGTCDPPFVPVHIEPSHEGYRWADLPRIEHVEVVPGRERVRDEVWDGELACVDSLRIRVTASDGAVFESPVCLAAQPADPDTPDTTDTCGWDENVYYVTPQGRDELHERWLWYHLGGFNYDGDTWDTQEFAFGKEMKSFWAQLHGPDEPLRLAFVALAGRLNEPWQTLTLHREGRLVLSRTDGVVRTIAPPTPQGDAPCNTSD